MLVNGLNPEQVLNIAPCCGESAGGCCRLLGVGVGWWGLLEVCGGGDSSSRGIGGHYQQWADRALGACSA